MISREMTHGRMIARLALLLGICLATAGAQSRCSSDGSLVITSGDLPVGNSVTFTTTLVLRDSAGVETDRFSRGELIRFDLTVRNRSNRTVDLHIQSGAQTDFVVFDNGADTPRWQWTDGMIFVRGTNEIRFAPQETKTFSVQWNQEMRSGETLPLGSYEARGVIPFNAFASNPLALNELGSTLRPFTVN